VVGKAPQAMPQLIPRRWKLLRQVAAAHTDAQTAVTTAAGPPGRVSN
jgi:hypothetical protein